MVIRLLPAASSRDRTAARLALVTLVGLNVCLFRLFGAIDYRDTCNSGTSAARSAIRFCTIDALIPRWLSSVLVTGARPSGL